MENLKDKLSQGFKNGSKFLRAAKYYRIVAANEPVKPGLLLRLLNAAQEVYFYIRENYVLCGKEAIRLNQKSQREYHQTGFCQDCQDDEEHQEIKPKEELN